LSIAADPPKSVTASEFYKVRTGQLAVFSGHEGPVRGVSFSADGKSLYTGGHDKTLRVWDLVSGKETNSIELKKGRVAGMATLPVKQGKTVRKTLVAVASTIDQEGTFLWDPAAKSYSRSLPGIGHDSGPVAAAAGGQYLAGTHGNGTIEVWDTKTGQRIRSIDPNARAKAVALSADGKVLLCATEKVVRCYDVVKGKLLTKHMLDSVVSSLTFSPDDKQFAAAAIDGTVGVFDYSTGKVLQTLKGHRGSVSAVTFTPDGKRLVSGGADKSVRVWDPSTGDALPVIGEHRGPVTSIAVSFDGMFVATGSEDETAILWKVPQ
jgi:WD40 repeat protein